MTHRYELIVGNVGTVLETQNGTHALQEFGAWKKQSIEGVGRASGEPVTLMRDSEPWREHVPVEQD